jgi:hypothetical protein
MRSLPISSHQIKSLMGSIDHSSIHPCWLIEYLYVTWSYHLCLNSISITGFIVIHTYIDIMALILGMLGGAAVVEIHRAITGNNNNNNKGATVLNQKKKQQEMLSVIDGLKTREKELQQAIRDLEGEIEGYANSSELGEAERKRLERVCSQLREQLAEAETKHRDLSKRYRDLEEETKKIQEREHVLEGCVESLKEENSMLISQFERLKVKHEEETASFEMQLKTLQENVSAILTRYVENAISVEVMSEELNHLGVEFSCMTRNEVMTKASTKKERKEAVGQLQLQVDHNSFFNQIHLTSSPTRAAQLFFSSSSSLSTAGRQDEVVSLPSKTPESTTENDVENDTIAALHSSETKQKKRFFGKSAKAASIKQHLVVPLVISSSERDTVSAAAEKESLVSSV